MLSWQRETLLGSWEFPDDEVRVYSFGHPKDYKPKKQAVWCTRILHEIVRNIGRLDYSELFNLFPNDAKFEKFQKRTNKYKILGSLLGKMWKTWMNLFVPKFKISSLKNGGFVRFTHSDTRPHFSVQSARQKCLVGG